MTSAGVDRLFGGYKKTNLYLLYTEIRGYENVADKHISADVNAYLREITGQDFTAKDFQIWAGTVLAARSLIQCDAWACDSEAKKNVAQAIEAAAKRLGNTPIICRKCYNHPGVIASYLDGYMRTVIAKHTIMKAGDTINGLHPDEQTVFTLLEARFAHDHAALHKTA